jgi:manganese/zinc/iron transport system permease protein
MTIRPALILMLALWLLVGGATPAFAAAGRDHGRGTITDRSIQWPTAEEWQRVLTLQDYNTRVVLTGTGLLGFAAGVLGCFTLLRKRALMGDALSHATLPGIGLAFMFSVLAGGTGKSLPVLLAGAMATGLLGLVMILVIRNLTRLKEDTALGIVLSVFFGAGVSVLGVVQRMGQGHAAGLESFIYGKTASMLASDAQLIAWIAALVLIACGALFKEFRLVCFDAGYAKAQGWPTVLLDSAMMCLVIVITVIGLQAVGLILVIALLIIPAAAARFWTERLLVMLGIAGFIGAASGLAGSALSALLPNLPSGAMIVLVATLLFLVSMFFGSARGVFIRWLNRRAFEGKVRRQHLLRAAYELMEGDEIGPDIDLDRIGWRVRFSDLLAMRSWTPRRLRREIARAVRTGLMIESQVDGGGVELTPEGFREAAQLVRQHRLWELYLITHADIAPSHVDRDADAIEHVLDPAMIRELETLLAVERPRVVVPRSPHLIDAPTATASQGH